MKVEIRSITGTRDTDYGTPQQSTEIFVDGVSIGRGRFGGEPEDNSKDRDYDWVDGLIEKLAKSLGADVTLTSVIEPDDD